MRRLTRFTRIRRKPTGQASAPSSRRQGSTIVVVLALLLALTFLGIVGYTIGTQEYSNAEYFSDAGKVYEGGLTRDDCFNWGLRQVILGTRLEERQSALHGGHMSLMATLLGDDMAPYTGEGIHLGMQPSGTIFVDQDHDPSTAESDALLEINRAPFANGAGSGAVDQTNAPTPDVDYTYWDINNPFLAYVSTEHLYNPTTQNRLVIPSFHRPQYLRSTTVAANQWYTDATTERRVLRPHREHRAVATDGSGLVTDVPRFVRAGETSPPTSTPFPFDNMTEGVWAGTAGADSYDADPDGDGFNEAVYLDLDFPMQIRDNPDGTISSFVPLFAFTILDADGLLNLNAHGNLAGAGNFNNPFGEYSVDNGPDGIPNNGDDTYEIFISRSHQGLSASEVSPLWALNADPNVSGETLDQHTRFFGHAPADSVELGNMEWFFLASGRADLDAGGAIQNLYPGRYGEVSLLDEAVRARPSGSQPVNFPSAGNTYVQDPDGAGPIGLLGAYPGLGFPLGSLTDDNFTAQTGGNYNDTTPPPGRLFPSAITFPAWRHPLDLRGTGRDIDGTDRLLRQSGQHRWPAYAFYEGNPAIGLRSTNFAQDFFLPGYIQRYDVDEPEEMLLEPSLARSDLDAIFGAGENATLHLAQTDQDVLGLSGRLRSLAPVNFDSSVSDPAGRRKRFTVTSWDLKSFSKPKSTRSEDKFRSWEYTGGNTFPPTFPNAGPNSGRDPFRPALRQLLRVSSPTNSIDVLQRKLSINHVLSHTNPDRVDPMAMTPAPNAVGRLFFRPLTPHPTSGLDERPVNSQSSYDSFVSSSTKPAEMTLSPLDIGTNVHNQEYLARRDRQQLCRDIYVLLYTFCSSNPGTTTNNVTNTDWTTLNPSGAVRNDANGTPVPAELLEMAQFAVNLVDRMDSDDVITKFEFDTNLNNGWNLNDNPYDENAQTRNSGESDRGVVYGVEQQYLTLHEAQVVYTRRIDDGTKNHPATQWKDDVNRHFTYVELENVSPYSIDLSNETWQLVVKPNISIADPMDATSFLVQGKERRLTFRSTAAPTIGTGGNSKFLIGTASHEDITPDLPNDDPRSHILIDPNFDPTMPPDPGTPGDFTRIVPAKALGQSGTLDLLQYPGTYRINEAPGNAGYGDGPQNNSTKPGVDLLHIQGYEITDEIDENDDRQYEIEFVLRRRLNPNRQAPTDATNQSQAADNPWITVDTLRVPMHIFQLEASDAAMEKIQRQITGKDPSVTDPTQPGGDYDNSFKSIERREPLAGVQAPSVGGQFQFPSAAANHVHYHFVNDVAPTNPPVFDQRNSLGLTNPDRIGQTVSQYNLYQTHFDREFGSIGELLNVPLYGPTDLTSRFSSPPPNYQLNQNQLAASRFLNQAGVPRFWYRLFEFVEVPDRSHRHYQDDPYAFSGGSPLRPPYIIDVENDAFYRRPGRVQLNTVRYPEVLGGLLDDHEVMNNNNLLSGSGRQWWVEFLRSRDGVDPVTGGYLPGLPVAKPFRDFGYAVGTSMTDNLDHTLLRNRPGTATGNSNPLLKHPNQNDPTLQYRLLEKALNNSTNRSNVFFIFMQVDFFEAAQQTVTVGTGPNARQVPIVRVGGKLSDSPAYRGFFVVDRSKIFQVLQQLRQDNPSFDPRNNFLPQQFTDPVDGGDKFNFSFNQDFDFHPLILHRQTIN